MAESERRCYFSDLMLGDRETGEGGKGSSAARTESGSESAAEQAAATALLASNGLACGYLLVLIDMF